MTKEFYYHFEKHFSNYIYRLISMEVKYHSFYIKQGLQNISKMLTIWDVLGFQFFFVVQILCTISLNCKT